MTFLLVHGAWHGAWCWDRLRPELRELGHDSIAVDLPADDPAARADDYVQAVLRAIPAGVTPVLVGHSLGGLTVARAACLAPVRRVVYLSALVPRPGVSWREQAESWSAPHFPAGARLDSDRCHHWPWQAAARAALHPDCDAATAAWAWVHLRRQCYGVMRDVFQGRLDQAPAAYILARDDRAVSPDYSRRAAGLLGVQPVELDGGHSLYMTDPRLVAEELSRLA